jgi:hypothetical protein
MVIPYISAQEFQNAPTGINLSNLIPSGTQAQESAELARILLRASAWIDNRCQMQLRATTNMESRQAWTQTNGTLKVFPKFFPIKSISSLNYQKYAQQSSVFLDATQIFIGDNYFYWTGGTLPRASQVTVQYTYVNGWPVSSLSSAVIVGGTVLPLTTVVGIVNGTQLTIYDGINTEQVTVQSVSSSSVTLTASLQYAHAIGIHVSSLPDDVRQACILVAASFIKTRNPNGIQMSGSGQMQSSSQNIPGDFLDQADSILQSYKRVI